MLVPCFTRDAEMFQVEASQNIDLMPAKSPKDSAKRLYVQLSLFARDAQALSTKGSEANLCKLSIAEHGPKGAKLASFNSAWYHVPSKRGSGGNPKHTRWQVECS